MRLIDKDSLLELIKDLEVTYQEDLDRFKDEELLNPQEYRDTQRGRIEGIIDCYIDVYNAEEVKAIPIEWIMWEWRRNQPDGTQEDAWMRLGVLKMLRDWRKENSVKISGGNYDSDEEYEEQMRCLNEN